MESSVKATW